MKRHKREIIILLILLLAGILFFTIINLTKKTANEIVVQVDNKIIGTYDLSQDQVIPINGINGLIELTFANGEVYVHSSSCPDKLCQKQGRISHTNEKLVCLPNKTVISIENDKENTIDGLVK